MSMKIVGEKIVTYLPEKEEQTEQGIIIAGGGEEPQVAEVVGVGPNAKDALGLVHHLEVGDRVVFTNSYVATRIKLDGVTYLAFDPEDIVGVLD